MFLYKKVRGIVPTNYLLLDERHGPPHVTVNHIQNGHLKEPQIAGKGWQREMVLDWLFCQCNCAGNLSFCQQWLER